MITAPPATGGKIHPLVGQFYFDDHPIEVGQNSTDVDSTAS
jgi:hypothetical protein